MLSDYIGLNYTTDWDGFYMLLPSLANAVGEKYMSTIPLNDEYTLTNTEVKISVTENSVYVSYSGYTHEIKLFQLDNKFEFRLKHMLYNNYIKEVI